MVSNEKHLHERTAEREQDGRGEHEMELRDELAARAMQAIVGASVQFMGDVSIYVTLEEEKLVAVARKAYDVADVMLRIRDLPRTD